MSKYSNTYGTWQVQTEGDCEGRTVKNLGTFTGHVDEIALHLADQAMYGLRFKAVENIKVFKPSLPSVNVSFCIESNDWGLSSGERVEKMKSLFTERNVDIKESNYYASFAIHVKNSDEIQREITRTKALEKLSDEEKMVLGLV
jgi:hypothetical protein